MPAFDAKLVSHMMRGLTARGVDVRVETRVKALEVDDTGCTNVAVLAPTKQGDTPATDERLPFGLLVWSAGLQQVKFVQNMYSPSVEIRKDNTGRAYGLLAITSLSWVPHPGRPRRIPASQPTLVPPLPLYLVPSI